MWQGASCDSSAEWSSSGKITAENAHFRNFVQVYSNLSLINRCIVSVLPWLVNFLFYCIDRFRDIYNIWHWFPHCIQVHKCENLDSHSAFTFSLKYPFVSLHSHMYYWWPTYQYVWKENPPYKRPSCNRNHFWQNASHFMHEYFNDCFCALILPHLPPYCLPHIHTLYIYVDDRL